MATISPFPTPDLTSIPYSRYVCSEPEFDGVVYSQTFEDKGGAFNTVTDTASQIWELEIHGLTPSEAEVYDDHYDDAFGQLNDFTFTDKLGVAHTGVRYMADGFKRSHDAHKSWIQKRAIRLIKRPA